MSLSPCTKCGGELRRSRRSFVERLFYAEAYRCAKCGTRATTSSWNLKYAHYVKCPRCHSVDLTLLKRRDTVDRMRSGLLNVINKLGGGKLYHCWFCRLQFYDMRQRYNTGRAPGSRLLPPPDSPDSELRIAS